MDNYDIYVKWDFVKWFKLNSNVCWNGGWETSYLIVGVWLMLIWYENERWEWWFYDDDYEYDDLRNELIWWKLMNGDLAKHYNEWLGWVKLASMMSLARYLMVVCMMIGDWKNCDFGYSVLWPR
jgi:hypothetical protein